MSNSNTIMHRETPSNSTQNPTRAHQGQQPLDLIPAFPLKRVTRVNRVVEGRICRLLQWVDNQLNFQLPTLGYVMDHLLVEQPSSYIFLATTLINAPINDGLVRTGAQMVVKAIRHPNNHNGRPLADNPMKEIAAMQLLPNHPNLISLLDCMQDHHFVYLVIPYLNGGDLFSKVEATVGGFSEDQAGTYLQFVVEGLLVMKTSGISHHDVSLENVMLDIQGRVKVIDFGMCLRVPDAAAGAGPVILISQRCSGKLGYVSPEVVREEPHDPFASDVWSLGVCLYAMLNRRPLYTSPSDESFQIMANGGLEQVLEAYASYGLMLSPRAKDLVCRMLHVNPSDRPTLQEILDHDFFSPQ